jgi:hypothetical protein
MSNTVHVPCPFWIFHHLREVKTNSKEIHDLYLEIRLAHAFIGEKRRFHKKRMFRKPPCNFHPKPMPYFPPDLGETGKYIFGFILSTNVILFLSDTTMCLFPRLEPYSYAVTLGAV